VNSSRNLDCPKDINLNH